jgi:D-inositol-3-phosphate glycosyltransferase
MNSIAFLILSTGWGGLEMNTLKLAGLLKKTGWNVSLIVADNSAIYKESKDIFSSIVILKGRKKFLDITNAYKISAFLKENDINTIFVSDNKDLKTVSFVKRFFSKKLSVIYQQHMQIGINKKSIVHTLRYQSINYWISPLEWLKNEVIERTHYPAEKIKIIQIGVDIDTFSLKTYSKEEALNKLNIHPKAPLIGIIGRVAEPKGQQTLIKAVLELQRREIAIEVLIFGSPTINDPSCVAYDAELRKMVLENNIQESVHFRDFNKDVALFYNAIDIFTIATESETYGMVTIEAMLSKLPIIGTNSGGTREILKNGELGLLFEYNNVADYCDKVEWVLNNRNESNLMIEKAQEYASLNYSQDTEVKNIIDLIKTLKS